MCIIVEITLPKSLGRSMPKAVGWSKQICRSVLPTKLSQKSCCDNDVVIAQNDADQTKVEGQKALLYARTNQRSSFEKQVEIIAFTPSINNSTYPPPKRAHYKINCAFIFYA